MKKAILVLFFVRITFAQVSFPNNANSAGINKAERISSFTVSGTGNDRLEIVNGTQANGVFVPTIWGYRDTNSTYGMVFTSSIASNLDNGGNPVMLFTTNIAQPFQSNSPTSGDFPWGNSGTTMPIITRPIFQWRNNSLKIITVLANGNVGIGTDNPTANLHNRGSVRFEDLADSTNPSKVLGTDSYGNVFEYNLSDVIGVNNLDYDWIKKDGGFSTSISDDIYTKGKVAINTNVFPSTVGDVNVNNYSLFVKGGILTEEVRIALSSEWADYVFGEDYELRPLEYVEKYIKKNKHLEDVPDSDEVKVNGIELGEMNKILLQKIEELTLYIIELNKKVELQNHEIQKLKGR